MRVRDPGADPNPLPPTETILASSEQAPVAEHMESHEELDDRVTEYLLPKSVDPVHSTSANVPVPPLQSFSILFPSRFGPSPELVLLYACQQIRARVSALDGLTTGRPIPWRLARVPVTATKHSEGGPTTGSKSNAGHYCDGNCFSCHNSIREPPIEAGEGSGRTCVGSSTDPDSLLCM